MKRAMGQITRSDIHKALDHIWISLTSLRNADLNNLSAGPGGVHRSSVIGAFNGLNLIGSSCKPTTVTLRCKILMLTWGGTPGFDSYVRRNASRTSLAAGGSAWPWRKSRRDITGEEYADMMNAIATEYQAIFTGIIPPPTLIPSTTHGRLLDMAWMVGPT